MPYDCDLERGDKIWCACGEAFTKPLWARASQAVISLSSSVPAKKAKPRNGKSKTFSIVEMNDDEVALLEANRALHMLHAALSSAWQKPLHRGSGKLQGQRVGNGSRRRNRLGPDSSSREGQLKKYVLTAQSIAFACSENLLPPTHTVTLSPSRHRDRGACARCFCSDVTLRNTMYCCKACGKHGHTVCYNILPVSETGANAFSRNDDIAKKDSEGQKTEEGKEDQEELAKTSGGNSGVKGAEEKAKAVENGQNAGRKEDKERDVAAGSKSKQTWICPECEKDDNKTQQSLAGNVYLYKRKPALPPLRLALAFSKLDSLPAAATQLSSSAWIKPGPTSRDEAATLVAEEMVRTQGDVINVVLSI